MFCYEPSWPKFPFIPGGSSHILFEHAGPYIHRSCAAAVLAAACLVWQSIGLVLDLFQFKFRMCNFLKPCLGLKLSSLQSSSCDHAINARSIFVQASVHHSVPPRPMDVDVPPKPMDVDMPPKPLCENRCSGPFCNVGPTAKLRRCSGCLAVKYCSPSCQQSAWVRHKNHCKPNKKQRTDNDKPIPELVDDAVDYCLYLSLHLSINYGFWHTGVLHWLVLFCFWCTTMCACSSLLFSSLLWVLVGWL